MQERTVVIWGVGCGIVSVLLLLLFGAYRGYLRAQRPAYLKASLTIPKQSQSFRAISDGVYSIFRRDASAYEDASDSAVLQQGESIAAKKDAVQLLADGYMVKIMPVGEVSLVSTIPSKMLFWHKGGEILYECVTGCAVRVITGLLEIQQGKMSVAIKEDNNTVVITSQGGVGTYGIISEENITTTTVIRDGQRLRIDDTRGKYIFF